MIVKSLLVAPLEVNCYVIYCKRTKEGAVIDPGGSVPDILDLIEKEDVNVKYIINTHGHFDHIGGAQGLQNALKVPTLIHKADMFLVENLSDQAAFFGIDVDAPPRIDRFITEGDHISFGDETLRVLHTPGHSPGGVSLHTPGLVFSGDALFAGSIGRTDLKGGSYQTLVDSVASTLLTLDDDTLVYPGHGPTTTIGQEKAYNPFF